MSRGESHLVAKDLQSKGKIERQFDFWQKRLPTLLRLEGVKNHAEVNELLATQIDRYEQNNICRSTGLTPRQAIDQNQRDGFACWRAAPVEGLLKLHLSIHHERVVSKATQISFLGRHWDVTPCRSTRVCIVQ